MVKKPRVPKSKTSKTSARKEDKTKKSVDKKTSEKKQVDKKASKSTTTAIQDPQRLEATNLIQKLSKNAIFGNSFREFNNRYNNTIKDANDFKTYTEKIRESLTKKRDEIVEMLPNIVPKIKEELGTNGSKNKIVYIIGANLSNPEALNPSFIRRLLDRYEELHGAIYPKALGVQEDDTGTEIEEKGKNIVINYKIFPKGKEELRNLLENIMSAIDEDLFIALNIQVSNRNNVKNIQIVKKKLEEPQAPTATA